MMHVDQKQILILMPISFRTTLYWQCSRVSHLDSCNILTSIHFRWNNNCVLIEVRKVENLHIEWLNPDLECMTCLKTPATLVSSQLYRVLTLGTLKTCLWSQHSHFSWTFSTVHLQWVMLGFFLAFLYPPQRSCRGVYWFHHIHPSVLPSVRL